MKNTQTETPKIITTIASATLVVGAFANVTTEGAEELDQKELRTFHSTWVPKCYQKYALHKIVGTKLGLQAACRSLGKPNL
jgi:hypothetical protein